MIEENFEGLKKAFMENKTNADDPCPMADHVTDYAFGELDAEEGLKVRQHIQTCRQCLELYMDIRLAEEESQKSNKVEVLPGLQKAIDKSKKPKVSPLGKVGKMISDVFAGGINFKPVAVLASLALIIFVGIFVMQDISPNDPYAVEIILQGKTPIGLRGGQQEYKEFEIQPGGAMESGDLFRFQFKIDGDAYIYVVFQDSSGDIQSMEKGFISGETDIFLPDETNWYQLGENKGTERLYLVVARNKINDFEHRVYELKVKGINSIERVFQEATVKGFVFEHR
jgi:hypothetical protein